jgi:hypothetical protein
MRSPEHVPMALNFLSRNEDGAGCRTFARAILGPLARTSVPRSIEKRRRVARAVAGGAWMVLFDAGAVTNAGTDVVTFIRAVRRGCAP